MKGMKEEREEERRLTSFERFICKRETLILSFRLPGANGDILEYE